MVELVTRNFWWPEVTKEVKWYIEEYDPSSEIKITQSNQPAN